MSSDKILVRIGPRWTQFTQDEMTTSEGLTARFAMDVEGRVELGEVWDEMDMAAERVTREMFSEVH